MNMKAIKKIGLLTLLAVAALFVQNANASLEPMLPESSNYDGHVFYEKAWGDGYLRGRIDFAVYDTQNGNEFEKADFENPGIGRFVYAYQIFNDFDGFSEKEVAYFAILGIAEGQVTGIGSQDDSEDGVEPGDSYYDGEELKVIWEFNGGAGYVLAGEHSWFLVFSSDQNWVPGSYEIGGPDEFPVPEPAMIAMLGVGSAIAFTRRRNSAR